MLNNISRSQAIYRHARISAADLQPSHYAFGLTICASPGRSQEELAEKIGASVAPAGEVWHKILRTRPAPELYIDDGNHATPTGSYLAAATLFYTISRRQRAIRITPGEGLHSRLGISHKTAEDIHRIACRVSREFAEYGNE
mgnify:CR=1 FL=1